MKTILAITTLSILTTTAGCNKKDEPSKGQGSAAGKVTDAPPPAKAKDTGPFASWDLEARRAAFQGAHVTTDGQAWNVAGDKVTVWDGTAEQTLAFAVLSPCEVSVTETSADGTSSSSTISHYTLKDGAIVMGLGDAGSRRGAEAVACISNQSLALDAQGTCTAWEYDDFMKQWKSEPAICSLAKDGDKDVFKATVNGRETTLVIDGDTMWSEQLASTHSQKVADFAAAKAAIAN